MSLFPYFDSMASTMKSINVTSLRLNDVRNNRSLAHDNPVLNRNESLLIFQHVTSAIKFVWTLDQSIPEQEKEVDLPIQKEDIPF